MVFGYKLIIFGLMRAPPPGQAIYISKGDQDHGPFSFEELVERMGKGQFAPTDLSWHQGVSNWMALEQLPEWPTIREKLEEKKKDGKERTGGKGSGPPPPAGEAAHPPPPTGSSLFEEVAKTTEKVGAPAPPPSGIPDMSPTTIVVETTQTSTEENKSESSGALNKILVGIAILFFLATVCFAGFILYKNWDKLGL